MQRTRFTSAAFTLVELMIVLAVVAIIATLAAPSFRDMILSQRLQGINAQLVTDLAFGRSEAVSRGVYVGVRTQSNASMSCYVINTRTALDAPLCDCTAAAGSRCTDARTTEIRTVQIPASEQVRLRLATGQVDDNFTFDPRTGGRKLTPSDLGVYDTSDFRVETYIDSARQLRDAVTVSGRISVCTPSGSHIGNSPCP